MSEVDGSDSTYFDLLKQQQSIAWERGDRMLVEALLATSPRCLTDQELLELILAEVILRSEHGEACVVHEYQQRFPHVADSLKRLFAIHGVMNSSSNSKWNESTLIGLIPLPSESSTLSRVANGMVDTVPPGGRDTARSRSVTDGPGPWLQSIRYEILEEIARGGMGVVYKVRDRHLDRVAALKLIKGGELADDEQIRRFQLEAQAAAQLDHSGIVSVYEVGKEGNQHFLAMAFVEGQSLWQRIKESPLPPRDAARIMQQVAEAIGYAHGKGIIHRDLKPQNILLTKEGQPKVTDFGLAKRQECDSSLTATGQVLGTPSYMPPEQVSGKAAEVGPPADIYSLGATLYCLLTGRPPFQAATALDTMLQVLEQDPVPPRQLNPVIPRDLETICLKCLEKTPSKRYGSAACFADELGHFLRGEPIQARPVSWVERAWRLCRKNPVVTGSVSAAVALLIAVAAISTQAYFHEARLVSDLARQLYISYLAQTSTELAGHGNRSAKLVLEQVPHDKRSSWEYRYLSRQIDETPMELLGHTKEVNCLKFSPNGKQLATASFDGTIKLWNTESGLELKTLSEHSEHSHYFALLDFSPDGKLIAIARDNAVTIWDAELGIKLQTLDGHRGWVRALAFSPIESRLATGSFDGFVKIWDVTSGMEIREIKQDSPCCSLSFSPDGNQLVCAWRLKLEILDGTTLGRIRTLREASSPRENFLFAVFNPNGFQIACSQMNNTVRLWNSQSGSEFLAITGHTGNVHCIAYSPDGTRFASASSDMTIKLWDAVTGTNLQAFGGQSGFVSVAFSPDGFLLAGSTQQGVIKIWDARLDEDSRVLLGHTESIESLTFDADGMRLASGSWDNTIKLWDAQTGAEIQTCLEDSKQMSHINSVAFRSDGLQLASGDVNGVVKLWDAKTGTVQRKFEGHSHAVNSVTYCPEGVHLASASSDETIILWDTRKGSKLRAFVAHKGGANSVTFSPDGNRLASAGEDGTVRIWNVQTGNELKTLLGHEVNVFSVVFNGNGTRLASAASDHTMRIWDCDSGAELQTFRGHSDFVRCVAFHPQESRIATGSMDGTVKIWDTQTGSELLTLRGHKGYVKSLSFNPKGTLLASSSNDKIIRIWDARYPTDFDPFAENRERRRMLSATWHETDAIEAEMSSNNFAACFHLGWLLRNQPPDENIKTRYEQSVIKLNETGAALPSSPK